MNSFFRELKQRKVYRVALGYAVSCLARHPDKRDNHARLPRARVDFAGLYPGNCAWFSRGARTRGGQAE